MDLGIAGRRALVCAGSKGLGFGVADALAAAGVEIVLNARGAEALSAAAERLRAAHGARVTAVAADVTDPASRARLLAAAGDIDILITNAGGPAPGHWADWSHDDLIGAVEANMLTPVTLMQACLPGMVTRGWGRVVNITSASVRSPIPELGLSNMARSGLTGFVAGIARQVARDGVTINNLLPGIHDTDRARALDARVAAARGMTPEAARAAREATVPAGRYGTAAEFGATAAFLCSVHAGFIVGQNILLDGGAANLTT